MSEIHLDFETRSHCDLKVHGAWIYSKHPSTEILCLSYAVDNGDVILSHPAYPSAGIEARNWPPRGLFDLIADRGNTVHAHNAFFERSIWKNVCVARLGWPEVHHLQWRCTLAIAAYHALPRSLDGVSKVLGLGVEKDMAGNRIMLKCSKPKKDGNWHEKREDLITTFNYNIKDVDVERAVERRLSPLPQNELKVWQLDQLINERGIKFDRRLAEIALETAESEKKKANIEMFKLTGGLSDRTTERKGFNAWTFIQGYDLTGESLDKAHTAEYLADPNCPEIVRKAIEIRSSVSMASVNKYKAMLNLMDDDDRIRDGLRYYGAGTGRWSGKGVQIQNFPRGYDEKAMDSACEKILDGRFDELEEAPMEALKKATRGAIISEDGKELFVADYSSVEARGLMWLVGDDEAVRVLNESCIYCDMATSVFGYEVRKADHPAERQLGKQAILGLGYSMGFIKFFLTLQGYNISLADDLVKKLVGDRFEEYKKMVIAEAPRIAAAGISLKEHGVALIGAKFIVDTYRTKYEKVKQFWKDIEQAAIEAVNFPGQIVPVAKLKWRYDKDYGFLQCRLPSGRKLNYPMPELEPSVTTTFYARNGKNRRIKIRFDGFLKDPLSKAKATAQAKGFTLESDEPEVWESERLSYVKVTNQGPKKIDTYGGKLTENCHAGDTEVLTYNGWVPINAITDKDLLWDGYQWVKSLGSKHMGDKEVITWLGVKITPDHKITDGITWSGVAQAGAGFFTLNSLKWGRYLASPKLLTLAILQSEWSSCNVVAKECLRNLSKICKKRGSEAAHLVGIKRRAARDASFQTYSPPSKYQAFGPIGIPVLYRGATTRKVQRTKITGPEVSKCVMNGERTAVNFLNMRRLLMAGTTPVWNLTELIIIKAMSLGIFVWYLVKIMPIIGGLISILRLGVKNLLSASFGGDIARATKALIQYMTHGREGAPLKRSSRITMPVYDIINSGPRHQYIIKTKAGPVVAHNCVQALCRDLMAHAMLKAEAKGFPVTMTVHDEVCAEVEKGTKTLKEFEDILCDLPDWAEGFPIGAEGFVCERYRK